MNKQIPVGTEVRFKPGSWQLRGLVSDTAVVDGWDGYHNWVLGKVVGWQGRKIFFDNDDIIQDEQDMKKKLEPRTVCDTTPAQQQYIYQRAKELGIMVGAQDAHTNCPSVHYTGSYISRCIASTNPYLTDHVVVSFAEFCERMENKVEGKITVTDIGYREYEVKFEQGKVVIGCFELSNGLVADIFECIKPQDHVKVKGQHLKFNDIDRYVEFPGGHRISYDDITKVNEKLSK